MGGSRFQIGGPAGAFIVLVALTGERDGVDGVILAPDTRKAFVVDFAALPDVKSAGDKRSTAAADSLVAR